MFRLGRSVLDILLVNNSQFDDVLLGGMCLDLKRLLLSIRMIWISHKHADHQCGLPRLFSEIRRLHATSIPENAKIAVIAPQEVLSYVFFVGCLSGTHTRIAESSRQWSDRNLGFAVQQQATTS